MTNKLKQFMGAARFDWQRLIIPRVTDVNQTEEERRQAKAFNLFFWIIFGVVFVAAPIVAYPNVATMISVGGMVLMLFVAFCAIMNSHSFKKSNSGRKTKKQFKSFSDLFLRRDDYKRVDNYIHDQFSPERKMNSLECRNLLQALIKNRWLSQEALEPVTTLLILEYRPQALLSFSTARSVTKQTFDSSEVDIIMQNLGTYSSN